MFEQQEDSQHNIPQNTSHRNGTKSSLSTIGIVIIVLLSINLLATLALVIDNFASSDSDSNESSTESSLSLPDNLKSLEAKMALYNSLVEPYNEQDSTTIYERAGALLKAEMSLQEFSEQLDVLYGLSGQIKNGDYSYYEATPALHGMTQYILYYGVETEMGPMELKISLYQQGDDPYQITGFRLNL